MAFATIPAWSTTAGTNTEIDGISLAENVMVPSAVNNAFREMMSQVAEFTRRGSDLASASTLDLDSIDTMYLDITGTTTVTAVTLTDGHARRARATGAFTLTASATLVVNGSTSSNYTTTAGDLLFFEGYSASTVRVWAMSGGAGTTFATNAQAVTGTSTVLAVNPNNLSAVRLRRNRIVNPAMQVSQENGNTAGTTTAYFAADQWSMDFVSSAGAFSAQRVQSATLNKSKDRFRISVTTADSSLAAGEFLKFTQKVEGNEVADFGFGAAGARQIVLRFGFKGPAGTYAVSIRNSAANRSYVKTFVAAASTDETFTIAIPGDTTGTWLTDTGVGLELSIVLAAGSTFQGTDATWTASSLLGTSAVSNGMSSNTNVFELFDVGLHIDPESTGVAPAWELPDYDDTLRQCQRYFYRIDWATAQYISVLQAVGADTAVGIVIPFSPVPMRAVGGTVTSSAVANFHLMSAAGVTAAATTFTMAAVDSGGVRVTSAIRTGSGLVAGNAVVLATSGAVWVAVSSRM